MINPFSIGKIEKLDFWDFNNSANFKHQWWENHKCKVCQPGYHWKDYLILFKPFAPVGPLCRSVLPLNSNISKTVRLNIVFTRMFFNLFSTGKTEKVNFWDSINSANFKHQQLKIHMCNVYQGRYIKKLIQYPLRNVSIKVMFILIFFEIFLFEDRSVLWPAQRFSGSKSVKGLTIKPNGFLRVLPLLLH